eukprot:g2126.t1
MKLKKVIATDQTPSPSTVTKKLREKLEKSTKRKQRKLQRLQDGDPVMNSFLLRGRETIKSSTPERGKCELNSKYLTPSSQSLESISSLTTVMTSVEVDQCLQTATHPVKPDDLFFWEIPVKHVGLVEWPCVAVSKRQFLLHADRHPEVRRQWPLSSSKRILETITISKQLSVAPLCNLVSLTLHEAKKRLSEVDEDTRWKKNSLRRKHYIKALRVVIALSIEANEVEKEARISFSQSSAGDTPRRGKVLKDSKSDINSKPKKKKRKKTKSKRNKYGEQDPNETLTPGETIFYWDSRFTVGSQQSQRESKILELRFTTHEKSKTKNLLIRLANGHNLEYDQPVCRVRDCRGNAIHRGNGEGQMRPLNEWKVNEGIVEEQNDAEKLSADCVKIVETAIKQHAKFSGSLNVGKLITNPLDKVSKDAVKHGNKAKMNQKQSSLLSHFSKKPPLTPSKRKNRN